METFNLKEDIRIFCLKADSFPDGIKDAFDKLYDIVPDAKERTCYGISYMDDGKIIYKAALEEKQAGEGQSFGFEEFTITGGEYLTETIHDWRNKIETIGPVFEELLTDQRVDPHFPCVEWYKSGTELMCMVKVG